MFTLKELNSIYKQTDNTNISTVESYEDFDEAIKTLYKYYRTALETNYVQNKIAWALYQTWKEFDNRW